MTRLILASLLLVSCVGCAGKVTPWPTIEQEIAEQKRSTGYRVFRCKPENQDPIMVNGTCI